MKDGNSKFVVTVVSAVTKVAEVNEDLLQSVLSGLINILVCHKDGLVHDATAIALRHLLQLGFSRTSKSIGAIDEKEKKKRKKQKNRDNNEDPNSEQKLKQSVARQHFIKIMRQALRLLFCSEGVITAATSRANLIWLAGEFYFAIEDLAKDILRLLASKYTEEQSISKMQILTLAVKYNVRYPSDSDIESLMTYVLELARYDMSTEVRDLARLMTAVCGLAPGAESEGLGARHDVDADALDDLASRASKILLAEKLPPAMILNSAYSSSAAAMWGGDDHASKLLFVIGSLSAMTGYSAPGYTALNEWRTIPSDSDLRDNST